MLRLYCATRPRPDRRERALHALPSVDGSHVSVLAQLVRPPVRVFRILLDRYGLCPARLAHEITPDGRATGRAVAAGALTASAEQARRAFRHLRSELHRMSALFAARHGLDARDARAAADETISRELRFLRPRTVAVLRHDLAHGVTREQDDVLDEVLDRIARPAHGRRANPAARRPAVILDIDLCALNPRERALAALRAVAGPRDGAPAGIEEFAAPEGLALLPTDEEPSWWSFLAWHRLEARHPRADWGRLFAEFRTHLYRPWERLRGDTPVPGLSRFVTRVHELGGCVVFNTGRRDRVREQTEHALARAGILHPHLLMLPDDRVRPVHELKAENLRALRHLDIVAIFDDLCRNRQAMAKELPSALTVAVALPGFAAEAEPPADGAPVVRSFELTPAVGLTGRPRRPPRLSHAHSLTKLPLGEMAVPEATGPEPVRDHAVHLGMRESLEIVERLVEAADEAAARAGELTRRRFGTPAGTAPGTATTISRIHHVLTRKQFRKGPSGNFPLATADRLIRGFVERAAPVPVVTIGFPVKLHYNGLKTAGHLPDLSELGALVRLRELAQAIKDVYPPGADVIVLTDGDHFRSRPEALLHGYQDKLDAYLGLIDGRDLIRVRRLREVAEERLGAGALRRRTRLIGRHARALTAGLAALDVTAAPLEALARADTTCRDILPGRADGGALVAFSVLFRSLVSSVSLPPAPPGASPRSWAVRLYADLFNVVDPEAGRQVTRGRRALLATTWSETIHYLAVTQADSEVGYDDAAFFPGRVRLTPNTRPGRLGFAYLGGSCVLPWHATAAVDADGHLSADFAIALSDQGFVPVYSPLLGQGQPWFMAPVTATRDAGPDLDPEFLASIRLRRQ
ncbi:L-tyrosine/L-tryptophan isonitrile synthase family protein [Nonomuraea sp. NPDC050643]|uniref:L-tyrosine/L-tryptophan isonitrile synthase family protein n=1 Tax=Nonomuraea sp. NPDC050643 TaxID=3155660 RepID=UPI0033D6128B